MAKRLMALLLVVLIGCDDTVGPEPQARQECREVASGDTIAVTGRELMGDGACLSVQLPDPLLR